MKISKFAFSGHESFPLRHTWLTKGVQKCSENGDLFHQDDAINVLGVGKNMVKSIRHWCLATDMLEEVHSDNNKKKKVIEPTQLGQLLFLGDNPWDPFMEDIGTLWLIHWHLATNPSKASTWNFAFNYIHNLEFTREQLTDILAEAAERYSDHKVSRKTLKRDVDVFIRSYVRPKHSHEEILLEETLDCPLVELNLIYPINQYSGWYRFGRGKKASLPDAVFQYAVCIFCESKEDERATISFDELAFSPGSPGKVFKIDEDSLYERLERTADLTRNAFMMSETAGLKQLVIKEKINPMSLLSDYYSNSSFESGDKDG